MNTKASAHLRPFHLMLFSIRMSRMRASVPVRPTMRLLSLFRHIRLDCSGDNCNRRGARRRPIELFSVSSSSKSSTFPALKNERVGADASISRSCSAVQAHLFGQWRRCGWRRFSFGSGGVGGGPPPPPPPLQHAICVDQFRFGASRQKHEFRGGGISVVEEIILSGSLALSQHPPWRRRRRRRCCIVDNGATTGCCNSTAWRRYHSHSVRQA